MATAEGQNEEDLTQWDWMLGQWVKWRSGEGADDKWYQWTLDPVTGLRYWKREAELQAIPEEEEGEENAEVAAAAQLAAQLAAAADLEEA